MAFKDFLEFPGKTVSSLSALVFGADRRDEDGEFIYERTRMGNKTKNTKKSEGALGNILNGFKAVGRAFSNFLFNHKQAIGVAIWSSLVLAGAAALTVFLWPAALAAVTTFAIAGYTIAGVVGANVAAQIATVAALTAVATSTAVYVTAGIVNTISAIAALFAKRDAATQTSNGNGPAGNGPSDHGSAHASNNAAHSPQASAAPSSYGSSMASLRPTPAPTPVVELDDVRPAAGVSVPLVATATATATVASAAAATASDAAPTHRKSPIAALAVVAAAAAAPAPAPAPAPTEEATAPTAKAM